MTTFAAIEWPEPLQIEERTESEFTTPDELIKATRAVHEPLTVQVLNPTRPTRPLGGAGDGDLTLDSPTWLGGRLAHLRVMRHPGGKAPGRAGR